MSWQSQDRLRQFKKNPQKSNASQQSNENFSTAKSIFICQFHSEQILKISWPKKNSGPGQSGPASHPSMPAPLVPVPAIPPTDNHPKPPFHQRVRGVLEKWGLQPQKPRKTPVLSNGAFLKNPVKRPDSIGTVMGERTAKGVHFNLFRSRVSFRLKSLFQR